jgi:cobalamin biosynthesis Mg chelatase CobN
MGALKACLHSVPALAGIVVALGLAAGPATGAATTPTNPASSALGPVSSKARQGLGGTGAANSALGSPARSSGTASGGTGAPAAGSRAVGKGTQAPGATTTTSVPTTTFAPPASSRIGTATPEIQRAGTSAATGARTPRRTSSSVSTAAIALAAVAALLALACAAWAVARWQAYEPRWTVSLRHAMAEAGFRASATWAEFTDWVRLGR